MSIFGPSPASWLMSNIYYGRWLIDNVCAKVGVYLRGPARAGDRLQPFSVAWLRDARRTALRRTAQQPRDRLRDVAGPA